MSFRNSLTSTLEIEDSLIYLFISLFLLMYAQIFLVICAGVSAPLPTIAASFASGLIFIPPKGFLAIATHPL